MAAHIKAGEQVIVTAGADRGRQGVVLRVDHHKGKVVVQNINIARKHVRPSQQHPQGGVTEREMPIDISNVSPVADGKPTRVRFSVKADGSKSRIAVRGGKELSVLRGKKRK